MAENSKIEWTDHTCNLWWGCTKVTPGCDHCYAETLAHRWNHDVWGNNSLRRVIKSAFDDFKRYQKAAAASGRVHRVFVGSMMDIFEKPMDTIGMAMDTGWLRDKYFNEVIPATPNLLHLMLTKRPSNINKYIPESWKTNPPTNVMFGTSPCDQATADKLIPQLLEVNGFKFLSVEPMLAPITFVQSWIDKDRYFSLVGGTIDWVICGGESGHGKRPFNADWARSIRDECKAVGVAFFMKQMDKVQPIPEDLMIREFPKLIPMKTKTEQTNIF